MTDQRLHARFLRNLAFVLIVSFSTFAQGQDPTPVWKEFVDKEHRDVNGENPLIDYSYAGYRFSEAPLPNVSLVQTSNHRVFNIANLGADLRDDTDFDDDVIRRAIDDAEAHTQRGSQFSAVIYFPAGFYQVSDSANELEPFVINQSRIVLKGAGAGPGGTVIHAALSGWRDLDTPQLDQGPFRFLFRPRSTSRPTRTIITAPVTRGSFDITVQSSNNLNVGDWIIIEEETPTNVDLNFPGLTLDTSWTVRERGLESVERHLITEINGSRVTLKNPVNMHLTAADGETRVKAFPFIEDVGVEGINFSSGWRDDSQPFMHHENDFVDYAFRGVQFFYVKDGWIRDCTFDSWNEVINIDRSAACTIQNIRLVGKKGHTGIFVTRSTGVLCRDYFDEVDVGGARMNNGQLHGPSILHHSSAITYLDCHINRDQSIDNHSFGPYANLYDNVGGGAINGSGGPTNAFPNSGPDLTLWNFLHEVPRPNSGSTLNIDFWNLDRVSRATFANPNIVGFTTEQRDVNLANAGLLESEGERVYPRSLFEAQLQTRLYGTYIEGSNQRVGRSSIFANDNNPSTSWQTVGNARGQWLSLDFNGERTIDGLLIDEVGERIENFRIEGWDGSSWSQISSGNGVGDDLLVSFSPVRLQRVRLFIETMVPQFPFSSARISEMSASFADDIPVVLAHWPLDEGSGSTAFDVSDGGHHGNLRFGARYRTDETRQSFVTFDGNNDQIQTPFTYSLRSSDDFTWSWWARKTTSAGTDSNSIMVGNRFPEYTNGNRFGFIKFSPIRAEFASDGVTRLDYSDLTDRSWHHYTMVKNGDTYQWYVDGVAQGNSQTLSYSETREIPFHIGGDGLDRPSEHFRGDLDDIVLYSGALSPQQIRNLRDGFPHETISMALLNTGTATDTAATWENGQAARFGLAYLVPENGNLWSARGDHQFPGISLKVLGGGRFQFAGLQSLGERTTVNQLITTGGTPDNPAQLLALLGSDTTNVLDGVLTTDGYTQILGRGTSSGLRNVAIESEIRGIGTIETSASGTEPTLTTISGSSNTFAGTWLSQKGTLIFSNADAIGEAAIEVAPQGSLRIEDDWVSSKSVNIADASEVTIDLGTYHWTISDLTIGADLVPPGTYSAAALSNFGPSINFQGSGFIIVPFESPDGPIARWAFDEGSGSSALDSSGNGHTGQLRFGPSWRTDSVRGSHLRFDGNNDRIITPFTYQLSETDQFTWTWWANGQNTGSDNDSSIMVGNRYGGSGDETLEFIKLTQARGQFANGSDVESVNYPDFPDDGWHHYALVKDGPIYQLYLDGEIHGSPSTFPYNENDRIPFAIGGDDDDSTPGGREREHFRGLIDDVVLYDRALSELEVTHVQDGFYQDFQSIPPDRTPEELLAFAISSPLAAHASTNGDSTTLLFQYTRNKEALAEGVRYQIERSPSLAPGSWETVGITDSLDNSHANDGTLEHRLVSMPFPDSPQYFIRLVISQ